MKNKRTPKLTRPERELLATEHPTDRKTLKKFILDNPDYASPELREAKPKQDIVLTITRQQEKHNPTLVLATIALFEAIAINETHTLQDTINFLLNFFADVPQFETNEQLLAAKRYASQVLKHAPKDPTDH